MPTRGRIGRGCPGHRNFARWTMLWCGLATLSPFQPVPGGPAPVWTSGPFSLPQANDPARPGPAASASRRPRFGCAAFVGCHPAVDVDHHRCRWNYPRSPGLSDRRDLAVTLPVPTRPAFAMTLRTGPVIAPGLSCFALTAGHRHQAKSPLDDLPDLMSATCLWTAPEPRRPVYRSAPCR